MADLPVEVTVLVPSKTILPETLNQTAKSADSITAFLSVSVIVEGVNVTVPLFTALKPLAALMAV